MTGANGDCAVDEDGPAERIGKALSGGNRFRREDVSALRDEVVRLRGLLDPDLSFRDLEAKVRDGSMTLSMQMADESQPIMRFLGALMLHVILGEGDQEPVEPPNYMSAELSLKPAGSFEEIRGYVEFIKPDGKSSGEIRRDLEAERGRLRLALEESADFRCLSENRIGDPCPCCERVVEIVDDALGKPAKSGSSETNP